jgi:hypothetical protein
LTTPAIDETAPNILKEAPWFKSKKMWIAVPLGLVLIGMNYVIFEPASAIAGMMTDSCSGDSNVYIMWEIWLRYLWPIIMLIGSLVPPYLILNNKAWWKVILGIIICGVISIVWYFLWAPVIWITGC